jgi:hypothetical protein
MIAQHQSFGALQGCSAAQTEARSFDGGRPARRAPIFAALALLGWSAAAQADVPPPAPAPLLSAPTAPRKPVDPAALASAKKLLAMMHMDQLIDRLMTQMVSLMAPAVIGTLEHDETTRAAMEKLESQPNGRARLVAIFSEEFLKSMRARYQEVIDGAAQEYATLFTAQELDQTTAFYSSGAGAKFLALSPQLQQAVGVRAGEIGREAGIEAGQRAMKRAMQEILPSEKTGS